MKKIKSALALTLAAAMSTLLLAGCGPKIQVQQNGAPAGSGSQETQAAADTGAAQQTAAPAEAAPAAALTYAPGTKLRMATGYNRTKTGLSFDAETAGSGITLADGVTYNAGDLKPTWVAV